MILKPEDISHWNIWFTNRLLENMSNFPNERIRALFKPYTNLSKMSEFFGLTKTYLQDKRRLRWAKKGIPLTRLEIMRDSFINRVHQWKVLYPHLIEELIKVEEDIINLINLYQNTFNPRRTSFSWLQNYHPNLARVIIIN